MLVETFDRPLSAWMSNPIIRGHRLRFTNSQYLHVRGGVGGVGCVGTSSIGTRYHTTLDLNLMGKPCLAFFTKMRDAGGTLEADFHDSNGVGFTVSMGPSSTRIFGPEVVASTDGPGVNIYKGAWITLLHDHNTGGFYVSTALDGVKPTAFAQLSAFIPDHVQFFPIHGGQHAMDDVILSDAPTGELFLTHGTLIDTVESTGWAPSDGESPLHSLLVDGSDYDEETYAYTLANNVPLTVRAQLQIPQGATLQALIGEGMLRATAAFPSLQLALEHGASSDTSGPLTPGVAATYLAQHSTLDQGVLDGAAGTGEVDVRVLFFKEGG